MKTGKWTKRFVVQFEDKATESGWCDSSLCKTRDNALVKMNGKRLSFPFRYRIVERRERVVRGAK